MTPRAILENISYKLKSAVHFLGTCGKIRPLFIPTSGHTGKQSKLICPNRDVYPFLPFRSTWRQASKKGSTPVDAAARLNVAVKAENKLEAIQVNVEFRY